MLGIFKTVAFSFLAIFGVRTEEQPPYSVVDHVGAAEIRDYGPRLAAEVTVSSSNEERARGEAFQILAGYIFGKNRDQRDIAMTAPVATNTSRKIAMTAPVETKEVGRDSLTMRFFLPAGMTRANAPNPADQRVQLKDVPGERVAALRFSGSWTVASFAAKQSALLAALERSKWKASGQPVSLFYDPPFTLPFLRRNEVAVSVTPLSSQAE